MGEQFHFDPDTYLELMEAEVPAYAELQVQAAAAAAGVGGDVGRILELGTGTGETMARVRDVQPDAELVGIDESTGMLEHARQRLPGADLRVARLQDSLPGGVFDLVVSALAIHHLNGDEKADLFARIAEALRPGGRVVIADVIVPDDPDDVVTPIDGVYDMPSTIDDQLRWLDDAGFDATVTWQNRDLAVLVGDRRPS